MSDEAVARIARRDGDRMAPDTTVARVVLRPIGSPLPLGAMALVPSGLLLAGLQLGWSPKTAAGIVGMVFVAVAAHAGVASLMEDSARRPILPLGRRGLATSFEEGLGAQLDELEHEAGVREQL